MLQLDCLDGRDAGLLWGLSLYLLFMALIIQFAIILQVHTQYLYYLLVVIMLVLDCNAAASVTQRGERNYFWPSSLATKVKTKVIFNTKQSNYWRRPTDSPVYAHQIEISHQQLQQQLNNQSMLPRNILQLPLQEITRNHLLWVPEAVWSQDHSQLMVAATQHTLAQV